MGTMNYSATEVLEYVGEEDVKFIRLAFCDVFGRQKNLSIMPGELARALDEGIPFDASAVDGFGDEAASDLFLRPDPATLAVLPWRPDHGRVVRMYCDVLRPGGEPFACDTRRILKEAVRRAGEEGVSFRFGPEMEFYLFKTGEEGERTMIPYDEAGYMDIAPDDRGENVRREICLTLEKMGIVPEGSHHEMGPGQNEIDFHASDPLSAADDAVTFRTVVRTVAGQNGVWADFSPKPLEDRPGNGFHVNLSAARGKEDTLPAVIAGILAHIRELTVFLNPAEDSYARFGLDKAPRWITWSRENRSQLIRVPAAMSPAYRRAEVRSPDPTANPYLVFAVLIEAALDGIRRGLTPPPETNFNLYTASRETLARYEMLPESYSEAARLMRQSGFVGEILPPEIIALYGRDGGWEF